LTEEITDPLAKFYDESDSQNAGVRDPITGIRIDTVVAETRANRVEEGKRKAQVQTRVITQLLFDELGREWLYDILTACHVFAIPVSEVSDFNAGKMCIGKQIEADLKRVNIQKYMAMIVEGHEREVLWNEGAADR
jgi:hypothetical protein